MIIREATIHDIGQMQVVRNSVKENTLSDPALIKDSDYEEYLDERGKGWVCEVGDRIAGFAIADLKEDNVWALFLHPDFEKQGIGRQLQETMLQWYFSQPKEKIWLSTAPGTRAESFYTKSGWENAGRQGNETRFEITRESWMKLSGMV